MSFTEVRESERANKRLRNVPKRVCRQRMNIFVRISREFLSSALVYLKREPTNDDVTVEKMQQFSFLPHKEAYSL
jgi:hypothetical protein